jgi:hypothetical protein
MTSLVGEKAKAAQVGTTLPSPTEVPAIGGTIEYDPSTGPSDPIAAAQQIASIQDAKDKVSVVLGMVANRSSELANFGFKIQSSKGIPDFRKLLTYCPNLAETSGVYVRDRQERCPDPSDQQGVFLEGFQYSDDLATEFHTGVTIDPATKQEQASFKSLLTKATLINPPVIPLDASELMDRSMDTGIELMHIMTSITELGVQCIQEPLEKEAKKSGSKDVVITPEIQQGLDICIGKIEDKITEGRQYNATRQDINMLLGSDGLGLNIKFASIDHLPDALRSALKPGQVTDRVEPTQPANATEAAKPTAPAESTPTPAAKLPAGCPSVAIPSGVSNGQVTGDVVSLGQLRDVITQQAFQVLGADKACGGTILVVQTAVESTTVSAWIVYKNTDLTAVPQGWYKAFGDGKGTYGIYPVNDATGTFTDADGNGIPDGKPVATFTG